ncbi:MAG: hypothetical protein ACSW8A_07500, partial [Lachnospiraceae bacterium]
MKDLYKNYLFDRHFLVSENRPAASLAYAGFSSGTGNEAAGRESGTRAAGRGTGAGTAGRESGTGIGSARTGETGKLQKEQFDILFSLAHLFNIRIVRGRKLVQRQMIRLAQVRLGIGVPEPFYRGFPASVRRLSKDQLIFDQLVHYAVTYGLGDFSAAGHSIFEEEFERTAFREDIDISDYEVITEEE